MQEATNDLRKCKDKIKAGDLVLLVNESFSLNPDYKPSEPSIVLSEFREFVSGCNTHAGYFIGANIHYIKRLVELEPGLKTILCIEDKAREPNPDNFVFVRADRIYIGQEAVVYGLKNDPLVSKLLPK